MADHTKPAADMPQALSASWGNILGTAKIKPPAKIRAVKVPLTGAQHQARYRARQIYRQQFKQANIQFSKAGMNGLVAYQSTLKTIYSQYVNALARI